MRAQSWKKIKLQGWGQLTQTSNNENYFTTANNNLLAKTTKKLYKRDGVWMEGMGVPLCVSDSVSKWDISGKDGLP